MTYPNFLGDNLSTFYDNLSYTTVPSKNTTTITAMYNTGVMSIGSCFI